MDEFKLNYYFMMYKNTPIVGREKFRYNFKKKHGEFRCFNELLYRIEKYQIKKYGTVLDRDEFIGCKTPEECRRLSLNSRVRDRSRLGKGRK